jgi:cholesterol oxidase
VYFMGPVNRRQFIQRSGVLAAAAALSSACSDSNNSENVSSPLAMVIGSGFAGSVAALRLGQAGIRTVVLERGQQWTVQGADTFPTIAAPDRRSAWFGERDALVGGTPVTPWAGLIERVQGDNVDALCGACVGGGSMVYGGVLIQPERDIFTDVFPQINYDDMDQIYYPRVLNQIGAAPIPDDILASDNYIAQRTFIADATAAGFDVSRASAGFDWDIIRQELTGQVPAAASVSEYVYGCNSNAKLSTDKNYLHDAVGTGHVEIRSLTEVLEIQENPGGGYSLDCRRINADGDELERYLLDASHVFLAAGSLNSSKLLLKSQQTGGLTGANADIGQGWGTNGDQLMLELGGSPVAGAQGGPASIAAIDRSDPRYPVTFMHSPANVPANIQIQLTMSVPDSLGALSYAAEKLNIHWPDDSTTNSAMARVNSFQRLLAQTGGSDISGADGKKTIWHPLGGALMGKACDHFGRLYGYEDLFVIDGSLLPGSAATVNPSLTIAANAERIMEQLLPQIRSV